MAPMNRRQWLRTAAAVTMLPVAAATGGSTAHAQSGTWRERKKKLSVRGLQMAYYEAGTGDPIVFLHGNPTSSYLWRNVIPHVQYLGRCIAPDMIGMGDSDRLPDSGPDKYTFREHQAYLFGLFDALQLGNRVTFVLHDWGSAIGFTWAEQHSTRIKGIAYMEAIVGPQSWDHWDKFGMRPALQALRSEAGEEMVLRDNFFIEKILPKAIGRGGPLRPGGFAGRDRAGRRRLDGRVEP